MRSEDLFILDSFSIISHNISFISIFIFFVISFSGRDKSISTHQVISQYSNMISAASEISFFEKS